MEATQATFDYLIQDKQWVEGACKDGLRLIYIAFTKLRDA